ncbi:MAG: hypothetical protein COV33_00145 [Candidatus Zambryskibacteria bacterium CG10_big_fil_rev_8_21_14_0_10_34_34]|uniref:SET domain-containing protein-lysine N-methyltransferase n=1 Tax=Candidatus Zambryskibacteria bacterium CG10_big_fil_rev_8_21_14_0_10_34_34 TaxID=1975114 RepID=A0A2H0R3F8_9BACT|nr:MAG: hypothetical protein COV33_00145 [Candidatus Zambryskibacteria bacterium CG10_big_fil_rev_8_21_14_0_10_34_34]
MVSKIIVKESKIHGKGIFTTRDIKKGEIVFIIKGNMVRWEIHNEKESLYGPDWIGISKTRWIDPNGPARFLNHSCNPNCGIKGKITVRALRNIKMEEEIIIDYSTTEIDKFWHMKCNCGSKNCRKEIQSIQFLPKKVYNKYTPCIPTYFMKVYNKCHNEK